MTDDIASLPAGDGDVGPFDIVLLLHVLEHVANPVVFLARVHALLRPGGLLVLEVPHCPEARVRWYNPSTPHVPHLFFFTVNGPQHCFADATSRSGRSPSMDQSSTSTGLRQIVCAIAATRRRCHSARGIPTAAISALRRGVAESTLSASTRPRPGDDSRMTGQFLDAFATRKGAL